MQFSQACRKFSEKKTDNLALNVRTLQEKQIKFFEKNCLLSKISHWHVDCSFSKPVGKKSRQQRIIFRSLIEKEKNGFHKRRFFNFFCSLSQKLGKKIFYYEIFWKHSAHCPKKIGILTFADEMISSEVNSKKLECNFDNLPEQNSTEVRHFWLNAKDEKQREFSRKYISCPKCSYWQVDCSLDNPAEDMSTINRWFFPQCPKMRKKKQTSSKKIFFSKGPFGHVERNSENPALKKKTKDWYSLAQLSKMIENRFLQKKYFHRNNPLETEIAVLIFIPKQFCQEGDFF